MTNSNLYSVRTSISRGIGKKFLIILVMGAAITLLCSALFGYYHAHKQRSRSAGVDAQRIAESVSGEIEMALDMAVRLLGQLAASPELRRAVGDQNRAYDGLKRAQIDQLVLDETAVWETSARQQEIADLLQNNPAGLKLSRFAKSNPEFRNLRLVDCEQKAVASFGKPESLYPGQDKKWKDAGITGQGRPIVSLPVLGKEAGAITVLISVPIPPTETGGRAGEIYAEYSLDRIFSQQSVTGGEIIALLFSEGGERKFRILSTSDPASLRLAGFQEQGDPVSFVKAGWSLAKFEQSDMTVVAGYAPIRHSMVSTSTQQRGEGWSVLVAVPYEQVISPINALFFQAMGFGGLVLVVVSVVGVVFAGRVLRPIHMLQEGVHEIGQGNLEHRIDVRSGDEIEMLAFEFNRMADRMQRTQEQLQRRGKELEQRVNQLRRLQAQLMQSERMAATGELAAQIAHEINNPLGIIKNYVGIAKMLMPEEDTNRENLKIVDQEINRIAGIVRRLLKFAKPGTEDLQSVQINQVLEELLALLRGQLFRRKIEISFELSDNLPDVSVSTDQMRQVFLNLIKNAEDAMPDGGKLTIRTRYRKGRVEIEISDTGCGIPAEDVKNIFEPFFTTKGVKGTGLGLSVSYGIVKNYSGEINVESEPGHGTTFTIQLPVVSDKVFQVIPSSS